MNGQTGMIVLPSLNGIFSKLTKNNINYSKFFTLYFRGRGRFMIKQVLFVCTGNTCRSSMAEALLRKMLSEDLAEKAATIRVVSAGTGARSGDSAAQNAIEVMAKEGIDLRQHRARPITPEMIANADLVLTMTLEQKNTVLKILPSANKKVFTLSEFAQGVKEIEDLMDRAEVLRLTLEEKRRRYLEREAPKLEELRRRNLELSRQMRALDEELRQIEQKMEQEIAPEKRELELIQEKLTAFEIPDPYGQNIEAYKICANEIKEKLKIVVKQIKSSLEE
jgi:protein-tyrosine phosphatase